MASSVASLREWYKHQTGQEGTDQDAFDYWLDVFHELNPVSRLYKETVRHVAAESPRSAELLRQVYPLYWRMMPTTVPAFSPRDSEELTRLHGRISEHFGEALTRQVEREEVILVPDVPGFDYQLVTQGQPVRVVSYP